METATLPRSYEAPPGRAPARAVTVLRQLFDSSRGPRQMLLARWLFLRALALIYFSAFFALLFQIRGLIGPNGILPAGEFLSQAAQILHGARFWQVPSLFWISSTDHALTAVTTLGLVASLAALFNLWPRLSFAVCFVCFLSFVTAAQDFSSYQSDGMLLEAGFLALFFTPCGLRPGLAPTHPPIRLSLWLLQWEWFRIYFESGLVKILSGEPEWRHLTAMIGYYQNSPLPTWVGWYFGHLPNWFQVASAATTLFMEFFVVLLFFLPRSLAWARQARLVCFLIVTVWEVGVILTGNYAFLNYLVLALGILLLDDRTLCRWMPRWFRLNPRSPFFRYLSSEASPCLAANAAPEPASSLTPDLNTSAPLSPDDLPEEEAEDLYTPAFPVSLRPFRTAVAGVLLVWVAYAGTYPLVRMILPELPLPAAPAAALAPFRIANEYGLFASMTRGRYEIEFQGSNDGQSWTPYPFRYKPQSLNARPGIYAPYQPRLDWNLWFASLGDWQQNELVPLTQERLLTGSPQVLDLFAANPFPTAPPRFVRTQLWQYWFTTTDEKRQTGDWWRRQLLGQYSPTLARLPDGHFAEVTPADDLPEHQ